DQAQQLGAVALARIVEEIGQCLPGKLVVGLVAQGTQEGFFVHGVSLHRPRITSPHEKTTMSIPPDPTPVLDLLTAFPTSAVTFASCSLGVFDQLSAAPASLAALAGRIGADADALQRLLDCCVGLGLLSRDGDVYANTPVAQTYLTRTSPRR